MLGLIASSALPELGSKLGLDPQPVATPYGSVPVYVGEVAGREVACLLRHGDPPLPPHRINYRANVAALADLGCTALLATSAVGSLSLELRPPALGVPDQILDFTRGRPSTYFEDEIRCVDFTRPYCTRIQELLVRAVEEAGEEAAQGLCYACMEGPRFETVAEIRMLRSFGGDLVGMTAMPEASLAREKGLCYGSLCVVTNLAAGLEGHHPSGQEVKDTMAQRWDTVLDILRRAVAAYADDASCACHTAPQEYA